MFRPSIPCSSRALRAPALGLCAWMAAASLAFASGFGNGNVVVVRVGDGIATLSNASMPVFLDEFTATGTPVQSLALPTIASGAQNPLTNSGTASSEAYLNVSSDARYLVQAGYGVVPGTPAIASTTSALAPRVVGRIEISSGTIDTSTLLNGDTSYSANNIRSATSNDGTQFWTSGTAGASSDGGVRYVSALGANTSTQLTANVTNTRCIGIFAGQLYVSSASGSFKGVNTVGTGLPTTSGQTTTLLAGFPSTSPSQYDFFFADANTLYLAEDGSSGATAGIEKWVLTAGTWTRVYTLSPGAGVGCRGLGGSVNGSTVTLFTTTTQTSQNELLGLVDTGVSSTFTLLATAPANEVFRGVRVVPGTSISITPICEPGVGGTLACPCGNPPSGAGRGCDNSAATGGATLGASGVPSLAADTLVFTTTDERATATSIVLQGNALNTTGVVFGQGLRCVAGSLKRLYTKAASGGSITAPAGADLSVSARSAAAGDPLSAAQHRYYMVYYRDPAVLGGCPATSTFNGTPGLDVLWNP